MGLVCRFFLILNFILIGGNQSYSACCEMKSIEGDVTTEHWEKFSVYLEDKSSKEQYSGIRINDSLYLLRKKSQSNNERIFLFFERKAGERQVVSVRVPNKYHFPDFAPDFIRNACSDCLWLRFGETGDHHGDFIITKDGAFWQSK